LESKGEYRPQMEGGTFIPLYPGDKLTPYVPNRPPNTYPAFVESITRQIGVALGLPYELICKDFSKTNYSSARAALNEAWRMFLVRRQWLATYWCAPVYKLWFEEAVNAGMIEAPDFYENAPFYLRARWIGPGRLYVDPTKEAQAAQIRMETMVSTLEMECAEQGLDYEEVMEQRALELERMKELDLTPPKPQAPQPPTQSADPPAEESEGDQEEDAPQRDQEEAA
jgi:lambda family phage portal protein